MINNWEKQYKDYYSDDSHLDITECPKCGRTYDDADYDFQICHFCKWSVGDNKYLS